MAMILEILGGLVKWVSSKLNPLLFQQAKRSSISQRLLDSGINRFGLPLFHFQGHLGFQSRLFFKEVFSLWGCFIIWLEIFVVYKGQMEVF